VACGAVAGMVSDRNVNAADRVAYMIPVSALRKAWPALLVGAPSATTPESGRARDDRPSPGNKAPGAISQAGDQTGVARVVRTQIFFSYSHKSRRKK
jgi:hypothetical protein